MMTLRGRVETDGDKRLVVSPRREREETALSVERKRAQVQVAGTPQTCVCRPHHDPRTVDHRQLV